MSKVRIIFLEAFLFYCKTALALEKTCYMNCVSCKIYKAIPFDKLGVTTEGEYVRYSGDL